MKKKINYMMIMMICSTFFMVSCNQNDHSLISLNSQTGLIVSKKNKTVETKINDKTVETYPSYSKNIFLKFDTYHVDTNYHSTFIINDRDEFDLIPSNDSFDTFYTNKIELLGLNIIDGTMKVEFIAGQDHTGIDLDSLYIRNVVLEVNGQEIWSNEYTIENYLNEKIGLGESSINSDYRFLFLPRRTFTFQINPDWLDCKGYLLQENDFKDQIAVQIEKKTYEYENPRSMYQINIEKNETIDQNRILTLNVKNAKEVTTWLDGIEVTLPLSLTANCWVAGEHQLDLRIVDQTNAVLEETYPFVLQAYSLPTFDSTYRVFKNGIHDELSNSIVNLGVEVPLDDSIQTPFSETPFINFEINRNPTKQIVWRGRVNRNRVAFLQLYNFQNKVFDTVATKKVTSSEEEICLAFCYEGLFQYMDQERCIVRVATKQIQDQYQNPDVVFHHISDVQYIVQKSAVQGDSSLGKEARVALDSIAQFVIDKNPNYAWISGDLVQKTVDEQEWNDVMNHLITPLLEQDVPFGLSSGNHDVGGLKALNPDGSNGLDDALIYDYYAQYVGEEVFKNKTYYGGSYDNNRSHYDLIDAYNHKFLFLHLGWGSSTYGVHVSSKDVTWAKNILEQYSDRTVIISTHEYLNYRGERTATGEYIFNQLVKPYPNVEFVFSGHINGSNKKIDKIDDDNDGQKDRRVLQILTDFQEEEDLYGATFIRLMKFYGQYNNILFDIYSPFYQDNDIIVFNNVDIVKENSRFEYAFDLSNDGFGIITNNFN